MAIEDVRVPDIGDYSSVDIIEICVKPGDTVDLEDSLITLETDKATMDVPSPLAGTVVALKVKEGGKVSEGDLILTLETAAEATAAPVAAEAKTPAPETASGVQSAGEAQPIYVPDIGDYKDVDVIEIVIKPGDVISDEASLITLETDKATMDIPAPFAGQVESVAVKEGDKVSQGDLIAMVLSTAAVASDPVTPTSAEKEKPVKPAPAAPSAVSQSSADNKNQTSVHASPSVRRMARELNIDLTQVSGTGRKGRISQDDLTQFIKSQLSQGGGGTGLNLLPNPSIDFAKFGAVETVELSRIKKISGANLHRNWVQVPHITLFDDADITDMEVLRKAKKPWAEKQGIKLTPLAFLLKAVAQIMQQFPNINSSLTADSQRQVLKQYCHIGFAVDTPSGLMVPVVRDVDQKGIIQIAKEASELTQKALKGQLKGADMQGGCFTISSLGNLGTTGFTPIVNMPEVAILGVSKAQKKPVWSEAKQAFLPRLMLPLSLSLDHRVVDGAEGARFLGQLVSALGDLRELLW